MALKKCALFLAGTAYAGTGLANDPGAQYDTGDPYDFSRYIGVVPRLPNHGLAGPGRSLWSPSLVSFAMNCRTEGPDQAAKEPVAGFALTISAAQGKAEAGVSTMDGKRIRGWGVGSKRVDAFGLRASFRGSRFESVTVSHSHEENAEKKVVMNLFLNSSLPLPPRAGETQSLRGELSFWEVPATTTVDASTIGVFSQNTPALYRAKLVCNVRY